MERQNNAGVEAGDLADDARLVAHAPRVDPREPLAVLSGTYRRNRPRRVVVSKWTMHAYLFFKIIIIRILNVHKFLQIPEDVDEIQL